MKAQDAQMKAQDAQMKKLASENASLQSKLRDANNGNTARTSPSQSKVTQRMEQKLSSEATLEEFENWRYLWDMFVGVNELKKIPVETQVQHLCLSFTADMLEVLRNKLKIPPDTEMSVDEILVEVRKHFRKKRNIILDKVDFMSRKQEEGESFDSYYNALQRIAKHAEIESETMDQKMVTKIIHGLRDSDLREKLLSIDPLPTTDDVVKRCIAAESSKKDNMALDKTKVNKAGKQQRGRSPSKGNKDSRGQSANKSGCTWCGNKKSHKDDRTKCPANGKECGSCGLKGHFTKVCFGQKKKMNHIRVKRAGKGPAPTIKAILQAGDNDPTQLTVLPDSGAEATVASNKLLRTSG